MVTEFEARCVAWLRSQFGSVLERPEIAKLCFVPANFPDVGAAVARRIMAGGFSQETIAAIAAEFGTETERVMTLVSSLCAGEPPLVEMVFRDKNGKRLPHDTFQRALSSAWIAKRTFVYWEIPNRQ